MRPLLLVLLLTACAGRTAEVAPAMPRPDLTPGRPAAIGAANATTAQLCAPDFRTSSVRPSSAQAAKLERDRLAAYGLPSDDAARARYELDHLIPLSVGGAATDLANLWPEPWEKGPGHPDGPAAPGTGAQTKDKAEAAARRMLCTTHERTLDELQHAFETDWRTLLPAGNTPTVNDEEH